MKLTIERTALLKALGHVQSVVERRNTIPILSNVLLTAGRDTLSFSATDLDMEITDSTNALVDVPGQITAPAHTLYEIVRKLPEGADVALSYSGEDPRLQVQAGRYKVNLPVLPSGDFPVMSSDGLSPTITVDTTDLMRLIDKTRFAISTEETRYYLTGIYLHSVVEDGRQLLRAVATDGHRLARIELPLPEGAAGIPGVIIPRKTINEIRKLIDEAAARIEITLSETKIRFHFDAITVISKLIDGTFPDYERVIPVGNDKVLEVRAKPFAASVDRVATISTEKSRAVKLSLSRDNLTLSATSPEAGSATEELEVKYGGPALEVGFNSRYLLDVIQQINGEEARFIIADAAAPSIVRDTADGGALYVLMPMRV